MHAYECLSYIYKSQFEMMHILYQVPKSIFSIFSTFSKPSADEMLYEMKSASALL